MIFRSGFVAILGRPNAGKSTLVNQLVGQKVAIVSPRPQTTRNRIQGIVNREDAQVILIDTPGIHKPAHELGCGIGQMREATGISLAVGALMICRKELLTREGGVYGPEACLDPAKFLAYMKERGITAYFDLEMTRPVV